MNYLAHIQLAHQSNTSMVGNFMGDFVKGSLLDDLPEDIKQGILLHRSIDSFTDSHPLVTSLKSGFPKNLRRMSGVVLDVYFDYLLCSHWYHYSAEQIDSVLSAFYADLSSTNVAVSNRFNQVKQGLLTHQWLIDYQHRQACIRAFYQIEQRLSGRIAFAREADSYLNKNHQSIEQAFLQFYPALIQHVNSKLSLAGDTF